MMQPTDLVLSLTLGIAASLALEVPASGQSCKTATDIASVADDGTPSGWFSQEGRLSGDGRYVVFSTQSASLVPGDTNGSMDVFRRDRIAGTTVRASLSSVGQQGNNDSLDGSISDDGRWIAFTSVATNLVPGDTNGIQDIFLKDMQTGVLTRVTTGFLGDPANGSSGGAEISADGRFVAFSSTASNLTSYVDNLGKSDVFLRDTALGTTALVSRGIFGGIGNGNSYSADVTPDGHYVSFTSTSSNLLPGVSDTNGVADVFRKDMQVGGVTRVSVVWDGSQSPAASYDASISDDGRRVVFTSDATLSGIDGNGGGPDVFLRDIGAGTPTTLVSRSTSDLLPLGGNGDSDWPRISGDGQLVAFSSRASNLIVGDGNGLEDCFVRNLVIGYTFRVSVAHVTMAELSLGARTPDISRDGTWTCWESLDDYAAPGDLNNNVDIFFHGYDCTFPETYCAAKTTSNGCQPSIGWSGEATSDLSGSFRIYCQSAINQKPGLLFYGLSGRVAVPFQGGTLCVAPPTKRAPILFSGGSGGAADCSGVYSLDMDAYAAGLLGGSPLSQLTLPGTVVNTQWWGRDPGYSAPLNTQLSNGLEYTVRP